MQPGSERGVDRRSRGVFREVDRVNLPWWQGWLRALIIVLYFVLATVWIPSLVISSGVVARLPRLARDLVGTGVWLGALALGIYALWWAERNRRI